MENCREDLDKYWVKFIKTLNFGKCYGNFGSIVYKISVDMSKIFTDLSKIRGVLQKFCIAQSFSACDNTVVPKVPTHVTEGIPCVHAKFCNSQK